MARMMNKTCSRGCCSTGGPGRPAEKVVWLREWKDEQCSVDHEYDVLQRLADERVAADFYS